jgi:putative holliday junction resolvase
MWGMPKVDEEQGIRRGERPPAPTPASAPSDSPPRSGTILAFDFGEKRIGVAVGETQLALAHPLTAIAAGQSRIRFDAIARLIAEWQPCLLVVGVPVHMDDAEHALTARARRFGRQLEGRFNLPVALMDERLSTREAIGLLHAAGVDAKRQKPVRDQVAAQTILQGYFDQHAHPRQPA